MRLAADLEAFASDLRWFEDGDHGWRQLPKPVKAEAKRLVHVELLCRSRRPRKIPLTVLEWAELKESHQRLADDLDHCRPGDRCGSLACSVCRRAWSRCRRWMVECAFRPSPGQPDWRQYHLTVIPFGFAFREGSLDSFDPLAANARLLEVLETVGGPRFAVGCLEVSYEEVVGSWSFWQPHWHILATGPDVPDVAERLRRVLPVFHPKNPSAVAKEVYDLRGVTRYDSKPAEKGSRWVADAPDRAKRRVIPDTRRRELLLWLHRWSPWAMLVLQHAELTSSGGTISIRPTVDRGGARQ